MDMYQKRKQRQSNKLEDKNMNENRMNINWYIPTYGKHHSNPYK